MRNKSLKAFTLTEMLIVIGIITLVALIAVPAFRALSGGRSTEAAQNTISAFMARTRTEALGVQERRGVLFYRDRETGRVGLRIVAPTNETEPYTLDLVADRDPLLLPVGVGIQFLDNYVATGTPARRTDDGYIGFNTKTVTTGSDPNETIIPYGGVILYDGRGQVITATYGFTLRTPDPDGPGPLTGRATDMAKFLYENPNFSATGTPLNLGPNPLPESKLGFVLYDDQDFKALWGEGRNADIDTQVAGTADNGTFVTKERDEEEWLDKNAVPVLVNRFNGTLLRAE